MGLPEEFLNEYLPELIKENVKIELMGWRESLPLHTRRAVENAIEQTKENTGLRLNFALNYGSRLEIVEALKEVAKKVTTNEIPLEAISEDLISQHLMSSQLPDPDLLIRTSGEHRLSNFMLWQLAYTEFYFVDEYWPDFSEECLVNAIDVYQKRQRRFGGVSSS
jgi:undecaprenyl diphosphate synthase